MSHTSAVCSSKVGILPFEGCDEVVAIEWS